MQLPLSIKKRAQVTLPFHRRIIHCCCRLLVPKGGVALKPRVHAVPDQVQSLDVLLELRARALHRVGRWGGVAEGNQLARAKPESCIVVLEHRHD